MRRYILYCTDHWPAPVLRSMIKLRPHTHEDMRGIEKNEHVGEGWRALQDVSKVKLKAPRLFVRCVRRAYICMTIVRPDDGPR